MQKLGQKIAHQAVSLKAGEDGPACFEAFFTSHKAHPELFALKQRLSPASSCALNGRIHQQGYIPQKWSDGQLLQGYLKLGYRAGSSLARRCYVEGLLPSQRVFENPNQALSA